MLRHLPLFRTAKSTTGSWQALEGVLVLENNHLILQVKNEGAAALKFRVKGRLLNEGQSVADAPLSLVFPEQTVAAGALAEVKLAGEQLKYDDYVIEYKSAGAPSTTFKAFATAKTLDNASMPLAGKPAFAAGAEAADSIALTLTMPDGDPAVLHLMAVDPTTLEPHASAVFDALTTGTKILPSAALPGGAESLLVAKTDAAGILVAEVSTAAVGDVLILIRDGYNGPIIDEQTVTFA